MRPFRKLGMNREITGMPNFEEHVSDLLPGYALACLDEAEVAQVKEHLAACTACRAELRTYQALADQLPLAAPQVEPPGRVKAAVMDRIQAQTRPATRPQPFPSWWQAFSGWARQLTPAWSLASLVLVLALAASNLLLWRQVDRMSRQQPALRVVNLAGTGPAPAASAVLVISLDGQHGTLVADDLPNLPDEQQFQLWLIDKDGQRTSGGVFSVRDGYGSVWVGSPEPLASYPAFGVTIEPAGGSPAPTGEKVLGGGL